MHSLRKVPTKSSLVFVGQELVLLIIIRFYDVESCMLGRNRRTRSSYSSCNVSFIFVLPRKEVIVDSPKKPCINAQLFW